MREHVGPASSLHWYEHVYLVVLALVYRCDDEDRQDRSQSGLRRGEEKDIAGGGEGTRQDFQFRGG